MKKLIIYQLGLLLLLYSTANSQQSYDQIVQNGGFENGNSYPTGHNQLTNCSYWNNSGGTCDWYTTQAISNAFRGPCPFAGTQTTNWDQEIKNAFPKVTTYDGSLFYAGFGSTENMKNNLSRKTYKKSKVKLSFWFARRDFTITSPEDIHIKAWLGNASGVMLCDLPVHTGLNHLYSSCNWYYYESDWINTDDQEYDILMIGGASPPNPAGDLTTNRYIYIDDIKLWNGPDCCNPSMQYEQTSDLPTSTDVDDYIRAGTDAGIPSISGPVTVLSGQTVIFNAGNQVILENGFSTQPGSNFTANIQDCGPNTTSSGDAINVTVFPNVITPNGDGMNEQFCVTAYNAQKYKIEVHSQQWGQMVYKAEGGVNSQYICMWNGYCNQPVCSGKVPDGVYNVIVDLYNCTNSFNRADILYVFGNSYDERTDEPDAHTSETAGLKDDESHPILDNLRVIPNPSQGVFAIETSNVMIEDLWIYNMLGNIVYSFKGHPQNKLIDLSQYSRGVYFIKAKCMDGQSFSRKIIIQ